MSLLRLKPINRLASALRSASPPLASRPLCSSASTKGTTSSASQTAQQQHQHQEHQKQEAKDGEQTHFGYQQVPLSDKQRMVSGVFSSVASRYDVMNDVMSLGVHRLWKDAFVSEIAPTPAMRILDCAGGTGDISFRLLSHLRRHYPHASSSASGTITIADINEDMLTVGRGRDTKGDLTFVHADAQALPFDDDSFDVYCIAFGMRNVPNLSAGLREARRVLRPGGKFCMLEFARVDPSSYPAIGAAYDAWSFRVIPELGRAVAGDAASYQYLVESIRRFPAQRDFVDLMTEHGLSHASYKDYSFGIVSCYTGYKV